MQSDHDPMGYTPVKKLVKLNQNSKLKFHFKLASVVQLTHHPYQRECLTFVNLVL